MSALLKINLRPISFTSIASFFTSLQCVVLLIPIKAQASLTWGYSFWLAVNQSWLICREVSVLLWLIFSSFLRSLYVAFAHRSPQNLVTVVLAVNELPQNWQTRVILIFELIANSVRKNGEFVSSCFPLFQVVSNCFPLFHNLPTWAKKFVPFQNGTNPVQIFYKSRETD